MPAILPASKNPKTSESQKVAKSEVSIRVKTVSRFILRSNLCFRANCSLPSV